MSGLKLKDIRWVLGKIMIEQTQMMELVEITYSKHYELDAVYDKLVEIENSFSALVIRIEDEIRLIEKS